MIRKLSLLTNIYWLRFYRHMQYLNQGINAKWYNFYHPASGFPGGLTFGGLLTILWWLI